MDAHRGRTPDDIAGIEAWRRELVRFAAGHLGSHAAAAEDIVQDAYEHLMRRRIADAPPDHARAWLYAVVRSRCRDERARRIHMSLEAVADHPAPIAGTDETVIAAAASHWMLAQVDALPASEREALIDALTGDGSRTGARSANAHYQALLRARRRLRLAYDGAWAGVVAPVSVVGRALRRAATLPYSSLAAAKAAPVGLRVAVAAGTAATVIGAPVIVHAMSPVGPPASPRTELARIAPDEVGAVPAATTDGTYRHMITAPRTVPGRSVPVATVFQIPVGGGGGGGGGGGAGVAASSGERVSDARQPSSDAGSTAESTSSDSGTSIDSQTTTEPAASAATLAPSASVTGTNGAGTSTDTSTSADGTTTGG